MNAKCVRWSADGLPPSSSLALLGIPFVFSQDELLTTDRFINKAKERGYDLDLDLLQKLSGGSVGSRACWSMR